MAWNLEYLNDSMVILAMAEELLGVKPVIIPGN
jgi:hypothetical protein